MNIAKKKVLIFIESLNCGGAEKSLTTMLNKINIQDINLEILMLKKGGDFENLLPSGIKVRYLDLNPSIISRLKFKLLKKIDRENAHHAQLLWRCIRDNIPHYYDNYDIAIGWGQGFATYYVAKKVRAIKKMAWINVDYEQAGYLWSYDKDIYNEIDVVVAVSDHVNEIMTPLVGREKVITISDIVDETDVLSLSVSDSAKEFSNNTFNIVTVARLEKPKTLKLAVDAASILKKQGVNFHWYIIGEGSERQSLESLIINKGLESSLTLLGFKSNPYPYMREASIYVQTSDFEGLGLTLIEAVILDKPIVSTNFPTAYGILRDRKDALIVEKTGENIAIAIKELLYTTSEEKEFNVHYNTPISNTNTNSIELIEKILNA